MKSAYAWQELLKQNGWLANGSDFPVESINPVRGFYAAVSRAENSPVPKKQEQHLTRTQALKAMTIWAAMAQFEEDQKGTLEPGKWADFVVLDKISWLFIPRIINVAIERTYCHGECL
jgi:predicted amidohydrolase YtcJ